MARTLSWKKSSASGVNDCVEWAISQDSSEVFVRNSQDQDGATLAFTASEWLAFLEGVRRGDADI